MSFSAADHRYMARALQLAERGLFTTDPNPRVGCLLVRDDRVVGEGWHEFAGAPHAEVHALRNAGEAARGATAYVTLEPCSHFGRTPPCCDALIEAGVARVVAAIEDPNPKVAGSGLARLREAGVVTECGLMASQAEGLNPGFLSRMRRGRPWVRTKVAMSLDGRTAMRSGESRWITGSEARADVQRLRARSSAILTGIGTLLADDPSLNVRLEGATRQPLRVVVDSQLRTPPTARMLALPGGTLLFSSPGSAPAAAQAPRGAEVVFVPGRSGRPDLREVMKVLARRGVNELLVEAGATLNGALMDEGLVDELVVYLAPVVLGDGARGAFHLPALERLADAHRLSTVDVRAVGGDLRITLRPVTPA